MEAVEKISVGVIKEKTKSKAVKKEAEGMRVEASAIKGFSSRIISRIKSYSPLVSLNRLPCGF